MSYDVKVSDGDWVIDNLGNISTVEKYDKLAQDLDRMIRTPKGTDPFDSSEGSGISDLLGKRLDNDLFGSVLSKEVYNGINNIVKKQQLQALKQLLSDEESIYQVNGVIFNQVGLKSFGLGVSIVTRYGQKNIFVTTVK